VYSVDRRGWSQVEGVVVVVCVVVCDESGEVGILVYVEYGDWVESGWGRIWSWHAFRTVCCHTMLSMQMAEVSCVWYWWWVVVTM